MNETVQTPFGKGRRMGRFAVESQDKTPVVVGVMVQLPINDTTSAHVKDSNCLTPYAQFSGMWVFQESELK